MQLTYSNILLEAERVREYLQKNLPFKQCPGTLLDIRSFLAQGYLVRIPIDAGMLSTRLDCRGNYKPLDYDPHSLLAVGYDKKGVFAHDANSKTGNIPERFI